MTWGRGEVQTATKTDVLVDFESQPTILRGFVVNLGKNLAGGGFYPTRSGNLLVRLRNLLVRRFNYLVSSFNHLVRSFDYLVRRFNLLVRLRNLLVRSFDYLVR